MGFFHSCPVDKYLYRGHCKNKFRFRMRIRQGNTQNIQGLQSPYGTEVEFFFGERDP